MRPNAIEAAHLFLSSEFPNCEAAVLAGSTSRGEETPTSDLDLVVFLSEEEPANYRESFERFGWKIEVLIHNEQSYLLQFEKDRKRSRPVLATMLRDGFILKDNGIIPELQRRAAAFIQQGPEPLSSEFIRASRYFMFDYLDDFRDAVNSEEAMLTLNAMSVTLVDFILQANGQWGGRGKTMTRALRQYNPALADRFFQAMDCYYRAQDKEPMIRFVEAVYEPFGGRLFDGFSMGKSIGSNS